MSGDPGIGARIRKRRQELGLTQQELGAQVGVSRDSVVNWESGRHFPRRKLGKVEAVLGDLSEPGRREEIIPPDLQRRLDRLTPDERDYIIGLLTRRREDAGEAPPP